ncbi:hypothetical protein ACH5RR_026536 [Cinchona calisaya]|uniref:Uncharacterized protein n=1 Tax=Cinchona calisaya TaxID=153742 RepID=A0ABD2Z4X8_9GENT
MQVSKKLHMYYSLITCFLPIHVRLAFLPYMYKWESSLRGSRDTYTYIHRGSRDTYTYIHISELSRDTSTYIRFENCENSESSNYLFKSSIYQDLKIFIKCSSGLTYQDLKNSILNI